MSGLSGKSPKFSSSFVSQRLNKVDEDAELVDEKRVVTAAMAKEKEIQADIRKQQRKNNEKEQQFRNKYRWAEKQLKLRTGKCEGYSFSSIKAGLKRQDFLDTINCSPANAVKVEQPGHLADIVKKLLVAAHPNGASAEGTPHSGPPPTAGIPVAESVDSYEDEFGSGSNKPIDGHMNEDDWQLARSRKMKPLRMRGSNRISAKMNLDSFIDSALSEQLQEKPDTAADVSLTDLQSPKLIESRFGWAKVRRAVATGSSKVSPVKVPSSLSLATAPSADSYSDFSAKNSPMGVGSHSSDVTPRPRRSHFGFDSPTGDSGNASHEASPRKQSHQVHVNAHVSLSPIDTHLQNSVDSVPSVATTRTPLSFQVPESVTHIRPKSAIIIPSRNSHSILTPVNEFVAVVRQEIARPKSSQAATKSMKSQRITQPERPKTATFRVTDTATVNQLAERDMIEAMKNLHQTLAGEELIDKAARMKKEALIFENYRGLIYRDPSRANTWQGVDELLSPAPYLHQSTDEELLEDERSLIPRTDMRWAGKTLNSYRPWSPTPDQAYANARGRGIRGSMLGSFSGSPKRGSVIETGLNDTALALNALSLDPSVELVETSSLPDSPLPSLPHISTGVVKSPSGLFRSSRTMSGMTESAAPSREASAIFAVQRADSKSPPPGERTPHVQTEGLIKPRPRPATAAARRTPKHDKQDKKPRAQSASHNLEDTPNNSSVLNEQSHDELRGHQDVHHNNPHHSSSHLPSKLQQGGYAAQAHGQHHDHSLHSHVSSASHHHHHTRSAGDSHSHLHSHSGLRSGSASSRRTPLLINLITRHTQQTIASGMSTKF